MESAPLFRLTACAPHPQGVEAVLEFNPQHPVYQGHFPGKPITPGVCLLQAVCAVVERLAGPCQLRRAGQIRYFRVHEPASGTRLKLLLQSPALAAFPIEVFADVCRPDPSPCLAPVQIPAGGELALKAQIHLCPPDGSAPLLLCRMDPVFHCR